LDAHYRGYSADADVAVAVAVAVAVGTEHGKIAAAVAVAVAVVTAVAVKTAKVETAVKKTTSDRIELHLSQLGGLKKCLFHRVTPFSVGCALPS